jgi:tetratricopeptide (TPR) repeat protein
MNMLDDKLQIYRKAVALYYKAMKAYSDAGKHHEEALNVYNEAYNKVGRNPDESWAVYNEGKACGKAWEAYNEAWKVYKEAQEVYQEARNVYNEVRSASKAEGILSSLPDVHTEPIDPRVYEWTTAEEAEQGISLETEDIIDDVIFGDTDEWDEDEDLDETPTSVILDSDGGLSLYADGYIVRLTTQQAEKVIVDLNWALDSLYERTARVAF